MNKKLAFIGAGSASEAILSGILKANIIPNDHIMVTNRQNKERLKEIAEQYDVQSTIHSFEAVRFADIILLAMKPYDFQEAIESWKAEIRDDQLIISILAGVSTMQIVHALERPIPVIRVMPNTSASIGYSATALSQGKYADKEHMEIAKELFQTIGMTAIVEEEHMHAITALSGSGPAYIYYMVEAMEMAAMELGLDKRIAKEFVIQTVIGAGHMLKYTKEEPHVLRQKITSPQGTTEAGIKILESHHFQRIVMECIKKAKERSEELAGE